MNARFISFALASSIVFALSDISFAQDNHNTISSSKVQDTPLLQVMPWPTFHNTADIRPALRHASRSLPWIFRSRGQRRQLRLAQYTRLRKSGAATVSR
jgi:hypothetical protein